MRSGTGCRSEHARSVAGAALLLALLAQPGWAVPAFPGAEGHGAEARGGRGGRVLAVTHLGDRGPGSLRAALEAEGPRTIVFRVGGTIALESVIRIRHPFVTVAGQTAPGDGILLRGAGDDALLRLERGVHDVVLRYLRLRNGRGTTDGRGHDNLTIRDGHDIIIDHVSMSWASDENAGFWRNDASGPDLRRVTIQRSILAEGLEGHSNGLIVGGEDLRREGVAPVESWRGVRDISIHHNLFAHNTHRNPRVTAVGAEAINNVTYNWRTRIGSTTLGAVFDYRNNYAKVGPMRLGDLDYVPKILMHHEHRNRPGDVWPDPSIHTRGNVVEPDVLGEGDDPRALWSLNYSDPKHAPLPARFFRSAPLAPAKVPVRIESARSAYASVLADVGANRRLDCEGHFVAIPDTVDRRILDEVDRGLGPASPVRSPADAGGYPELASGTPCADADGDGMPDLWERAHGLDPDDGTDGARDVGDGTTHLERYLAGTPVAPPAAPVLLP